MITFLISAVVASIFAPVSDSSAQTITVENRATGYYLSVTSPASVSLDVTPTSSGAVTVSDPSLVHVVTNAPGGYKLYLSATEVNLISEDINTKFTPTESNNTLSPNSWGYSLNNTTWNVISTTQTIIDSQNTSNYPNGNDTTVYYGVNANTTMLADTYSTIVTYTAIAEGIPDIYTMQGFTTTQCTNMATNENIILMDTRDGKNYRITKLADGNCWMTQNLALDGGRTLTPEDSNVTENRTLPPNIADGTASVNTISQVYSGAAEETDAKGNVYGNHYNFMAATANTGTVSATGVVYESVCPKNWVLPNSTGNHSYEKLFGAYNLPTSNTSNHDASVFQQAPLYFSTANRYIGALDPSNVHGSYWTRYAYGQNADSFRFYPALRIVNVHSSDIKSNGYSVRCVFLGDTITDGMYMQDITTTMCNNLAESTATANNRRTVIDGRDGKSYKISHLADGNCWMVQNLALDGGRTLQPTDSNVTSNVTLPANIALSSMTSESVMQIASKMPGYDGNYYNWCASVATTNCNKLLTEPQSSICPIRWRMPRRLNGGYGEEYQRLLVKYGLPRGYNNVNYTSTMQSAPLFFTMSREDIGWALYWINAVQLDGSTHYTWTLGYNSSKFNNPATGQGLAGGRSVRCLLSSS